jgi:hypothetical protein
VIIFCLPTTPDAVPWTAPNLTSFLDAFNYAPLVTVVMLLGVWAAWEISAKHWFTGPIRTVDDPNVATPLDAALMPAD